MHDYNDHHTHAHSHADGSVHTHGHAHEHGHEHDHNHNHTGQGAVSEKEEVKALLNYMLSHNEHHAEELMGISDRFRDLDMEANAELLDMAISHYKKGNELVEKALLGIGE